MNFKTWTRIIALTLFAALAIPARLAAQSKQHEYYHYKLMNVGTFGGPNSSNAWASINEAGGI